MIFVDYDADARTDAWQEAVTPAITPVAANRCPSSDHFFLGYACFLAVHVQIIPFICLMGRQERT